MTPLIGRLKQQRSLTKEEYIALLQEQNEETSKELFALARQEQKKYYGQDIYIRGLIELTNYCKNDCYYCGIRKSNHKASRYRLTKEAVIDACESGYALGFRTFVLQGGEDYHYSDKLLCHMIAQIKSKFPDCAVTLSLGERSFDSYKCLYQAGADRYLLRHETATDTHYQKLHPDSQSLSIRKQCLFSLKNIGYQVGSGFMVGSPGQTNECLAEDLLFLKELHPQMIGIGPFIPHHDTPFAKETPGTLEKTLFLLAILRIMFPNALLPATTALGTIHPKGREFGILAGANVVMPNLSPLNVRSKYLLYDNKISTGDEAAECLEQMKQRMKAIGYQVIVARGDYRKEGELYV